MPLFSKRNSCLQRMWSQWVPSCTLEPINQAARPEEWSGKCQKPILFLDLENRIM